MQRPVSGVTRHELIMFQREEPATHPLRRSLLRSPPRKRDPDFPRRTALSPHGGTLVIAQAVDAACLHSISASDFMNSSCASFGQEDTRSSRDFDAVLLMARGYQAELSEASRVVARHSVNLPSLAARLLQSHPAPRQTLKRWPPRQHLRKDVYTASSCPGSQWWS